SFAYNAAPSRLDESQLVMEAFLTTARTGKGVLGPGGSIQRLGISGVEGADISSSSITSASGFGRYCDVPAIVTLIPRFARNRGLRTSGRSVNTASFSGLFLPSHTSARSSCERLSCGSNSNTSAPVALVSNVYSTVRSWFDGNWTIRGANVYPAN